MPVVRIHYSPLLLKLKCYECNNLPITTSPSMSIRVPGAPSDSGICSIPANKEMTKLVESFGIPVVTTIMGKGAIPTNHELYVGNLGIHGSYAANTAISNCDVLFSIGTRFNDRITGKSDKFAKNATIIQWKEFIL